MSNTTEKKFFPYFSSISPDLDTASIVGFQTEYLNELLRQLCYYADIELSELEQFSKQIRIELDF